MTDNFTITAGVGTTVRTLEKSGLHRQMITVDVGSTTAEYLLTTGSANRAQSLPVTIAPDQSTMVTAGSITNSYIKIYESTDGILSGSSVLTPKFSPITAWVSGSTTIISAVTGKKLRILSYSIVCSGSTGFRWRSHTTTASATGNMVFSANGGISVGNSPFGHFETVSGEALDVYLSTSASVGGHLTYLEV